MLIFSFFFIRFEKNTTNTAICVSKQTKWEIKKKLFCDNYNKNKTINIDTYTNIWQQSSFSYSIIQV